MIDWNKSAELNGVCIDELITWFDKHPQSHKKVWRICEGVGCDDERTVSFRDYHHLCHLCSKRTPEARELAKLKADNQWANQDNRDAMSTIKNDFYKHNTRFSEKQSQIMIQWNKDHPEAGKTHSDFMKERCNNPEVLSTMSEASIKYYKDNPNAGKEHGIKMKQYYKDNPEMRERISAREQGQDYDAGGWTGFIDDRSRPHVIPINRCIKINERFIGAEGHHMTPSIVVFIPAELHNHIGHNIKTGDNMGEMNVLAIQYINGGL